MYVHLMSHCDNFKRAPSLRLKIRSLMRRAYTFPLVDLDLSAGIVLEIY